MYFSISYKLLAWQEMIGSLKPDRRTGVRRMRVGFGVVGARVLLIRSSRPTTHLFEYPVIREVIF